MDFLCALGASLEQANLRRAAEIVAGKRYGQGSPLQNTRDFIRYEQELVQRELDALRAVDDSCYAHVVAAANAAIARVGGIGGHLRFPTLARAVRRVTRRLARPIDFSRREDRELLGNAIARSLYD